FTCKTTFGEVTVQPARIRHNRDGSIESPSARAWNTSHQLAITQNLRDARCDQMSDQSAGESRADLGRDAHAAAVPGSRTIVEPDEVKTKAQPSAGRKDVWTFTAVVLVAGWRYAFAEATAEGLWRQVGALLLELGVVNGERRVLVLGDGASWIRTWFEGLGI